MITLWISTRLSKCLACVLFQSVVSLAFSSCLIRSPTSRWRHDINCYYNREQFSWDGIGRRRSSGYSTSKNSKPNLLIQRHPIALRLGQIIPSHERQESKIIVLRRGGHRYSTWLVRVIRPIVRWYRVVAVSLLVMVSSIAIAASTTATPAATTSTTIRSQGSTTSSSPSPTPFTKVANAVSNTFLIGATAAAGAALGRYFILTKEAEKEREILEREVEPSLTSGTTTTTTTTTTKSSVEVVVVPTLSTEELSLSLSIEPPEADDKEILVNETSNNDIVTEVVTSNQVHYTTPREEALNPVLQRENNGDYIESSAPMKEEKEDKPFKGFQWNNSKKAASSAALSLQLIETDDEGVKDKSMTKLSERVTLANKKVAGSTSSRFPFSSKRPTASSTRSEGMVKTRSTNNVLTETRLAAKYAAMTPETRAYTILLDLGLIQEHQDPDDPMYDTTHDDDYCF